MTPSEDLAGNNGAVEDLQPETPAAAETTDATPSDDSEQPVSAGQATESAENGDLTVEQRLEAQVSDLKDQLLRRSAEMDNMRKRLQRERIQLFEQARSSAIESFLPVNDDLLRTLDALRGAQADPTFLDGIRMVADKFASILSSYGVETISDAGVPFNVDLHEALMKQAAPTPDTPSNTVLQVLESGYRMGERVIRHAKVIVSE